MEQQEYLIGDVADILGISRDTLRYYEKRGILPAKKLSNGYRCYSEEDIFVLSSILYFRKMNMGLEQIGDFFQEELAPELYMNMIKERIRQEELALLEHRRTLVRLRNFQKDHEKIREHTGRVSIQPFPDAYILAHCDSPKDGIFQWLKLSQQHGGLDLCYICDFYDFQEGFDLDTTSDMETPCYHASLTPSCSQVLFYKAFLKEMQPEYDFSDCSSTDAKPCIYMAAESATRMPPLSAVASMRKTALDMGVIPAPQVISNFLTRMSRNGSYVNLLELYIPILR